MSRCITSTLAAILLFASASRVEAGDFAAVAWSPSTGKTGFSSGGVSAASSLSTALLGAGNSSKTVRLFVKNGFAVIVSDSTGRYGAGVGKTYAEALMIARRACPAGTVRIWAGSLAR